MWQGYNSSRTCFAGVTATLLLTLRASRRVVVLLFVGRWHVQEKSSVLERFGQHAHLFRFTRGREEDHICRARTLKRPQLHAQVYRGSEGVGAGRSEVFIAIVVADVVVGN